MLSPNGIKTILFDLDGTLRFNSPTGPDVVSGQMAAQGLHFSRDDRIRCLRWEHEYWAGSSELTADLDVYLEDSRDFWQNYNRRLLIAFGAEAARAHELAPALGQYMWENYRPESVTIPESPAILTQLKQAGFRLGVVSNRDRPFVDELEKIGLDSFFEFFLAGGEVQIYKPEPGIFEAALLRMGSGAHEAVYVGDNYFADVVGARRAGLRPVLFDPDGLYPEADCCVIRSFEQLPAALKTL